MTYTEKDILTLGIPLHRLSDFLYRQHPVTFQIHPAQDDLASAGLGRAGLSSLTPPSFAVADNPTPLELRRRAIYENYRAIADTSEGGGFGKFYGPGIGYGLKESPDEFIEGVEVRGVLQDAASVVVQLPSGFQPTQPTVILIPSSSSRGVYGGILVAEWALQRGYATVLTDKGSGTGFHVLSPDTVITHSGKCVQASQTDEPVTFRVPDSKERLASFIERHPHRVASKQAHSTLNVEAKWPEYVLESCRFAKLLLSTLWPDEFRAENCTVIAGGFSNGGGASIRAAEIDAEGLITGLAVAEPNVTPLHDDRFVIQQGARAPLTRHSRSLLEYSSILNLYQSVAGLSLEHEVMPPYSQEAALRRLKALQNKGLWARLSAAEASLEARRLIESAGFLPEQNYLAASHSTAGIYEAMSVSLANCHGRFQVTDHLFGFSYAAVEDKTFKPRSLHAVEQARLFAISNGLVPTAGVTVVNDNSLGGPVQSTHSISPSSGIADQNLDGALNLLTVSDGRDPLTGRAPVGLTAEISARIRNGISECRASGDLGGKPAVIVNGRCDSIIAPNHASRAYLGRNICQEGTQSRLSYIEIEHAHHLDSLNALPMLAERYVPLTPYLFEALTLLDSHLKEGARLPESQVVRSKLRERNSKGVEPLDRRHVPSIETPVREADLIILRDGVLKIPD